MPATLGLSTYRWNNNLKSILLLGLFPFLLLALLGGIFFAFGWVYGQQPGAYGAINPYMFQSFGLPVPAGAQGPLGFAEAAIIQYWPIVLGIATVWVLIGYAFNDQIIHMATGAKPVTRQDMPKLYNTLENLCISRGLKTPNLYVIDRPEMNAYASGIDQKSYAITVTSGLLDRLDDKELEAVLGHELTHIINRDCRLLIVTVVFVGMISFAAQLLWRSLNIMAYTRSNNRSGGGVAILMLVAGVMLGIGYVLALVLRFAISRRREYLADAGSVELTKSPEALIAALRKISDNPMVPHVPTEVRQMFIENPPSGFDLGGLFATHPPIADRIRVLEELGGLPPEGKSVIPPS
ncbi:MAG TPA: M48 family metallopeptidase [Alphaproteobacteria bacterium]|nr:M48 family metallopeptidase [Alphaproteobacteria bacterium]